MKPLRPALYSTMIKILLFTILAVFLVGCDSCKTPSTEPKKSELVGEWNLSFDAKELLLARGYTKTNARISLIESGRFFISNMPSFWRSPFGRADGKYENLSGEWGTYHFPDNGGVLLSLDAETVNEVSVNFDYAGCYICESENELYFQIYIGDPDEGNVLLFTKKKI